MNLFDLDDSIDSSCNVGGFGIDGTVSTLVGQSVADKNRLYFGLIGDLAFFYDMNGLGIRHISRNLRLLVVNNHRGVEFRLNPGIEHYFEGDLDLLTAAGGHFGSAKGWVESMGFHYMTASTKNEFLSAIEDFCNPDINRFDCPVFFEVFTEVEDEQEGLRIFTDANLVGVGSKVLNSAKNVARKILPHKTFEQLKKLLKKTIKK
jgi:2-succinyl-5-enolpyruvyl-6-hydroxy-3-cyclohexene-1-carboxylate synthase